jgi:hypothetical protein
MHIQILRGYNLFPLTYMVLNWSSLLRENKYSYSDPIEHSHWISTFARSHLAQYIHQCWVSIKNILRYHLGVTGVSLFDPFRVSLWMISWLKNLITCSCRSENRMVRTETRKNEHWYSRKVWHIYPPGKFSGAMCYS